jgi:hypothetical protein
MNGEEKEVNRKTLWIMGGILLALLLGAGGYYIWYQQQQIREIIAIGELEKEKMYDQAEEILSLQFEGQKFSVGSDSLVALLETEQAKVQRLKEEVSTVKATNLKRINELSRELESLRKVARNYVEQIDSLIAENDKLRDENRQVTQRYQRVSSQAVRQTKEIEKLSQRVQMASKLIAANIQVTPVTSKGKVAKKIKNATQLTLTFVISKNITAPVGEQIIYVRLMKPDDDILTKPNGGTFPFENKEIAYSMKRSIEYDGEEQSVTMYWDIGEYLSPGAYRADIFAEGNLIGRKSFVLEE